MASTSVSPQIGMTAACPTPTGALQVWWGGLGSLDGCAELSDTVSRPGWLWHVNVNVNVPDRTVLYSSAKTLQAA